MNELHVLLHLEDLGAADVADLLATRVNNLVMTQLHLGVETLVAHVAHVDLGAGVEVPGVLFEVTHLDPALLALVGHRLLVHHPHVSKYKFLVSKCHYSPRTEESNPLEKKLREN